MTRLENIDRRLAQLAECDTQNSATTHKFWMQLVKEFNVPSYVVEEFHSAAFNAGADCQEKFELRSEKYELERLSRMDRIKKLFRK